MKRIKTGVIGIGGMGMKYCQDILEKRTPELELTAVAHIGRRSREWAARELPQSAAVFDAGEALMDSGLCEAVIITTPHDSHPRLTIRALESGLHVLCEKPSGVYTKQVREMNEAAKRSDRTFGLILNQRTNGVYRKLREMVQCGRYGKLKRVNWIITDWYRPQAYFESGGWRATWDGEGGGVLLNQCYHNLDLLWWICGMPSRVRAFCHMGKWHRIEVEDDVTAYLEFPGGATGVFVTSTGDAPGTNRLEITLEKGKLVCENNRLTFYELDVNEREFCFSAADGFSKPGVSRQEVEPEEGNEQHIGVLNAFAANILRKEPLVARGEEGIYALELCNAMYLSSWMQETVELPIDDDLYLEYLNRRRKKRE